MKYFICLIAMLLLSNVALARPLQGNFDPKSLEGLYVTTGCKTNGSLEDNVLGLTMGFEKEFKYKISYEPQHGILTFRNEEIYYNPNLTIRDINQESVPFVVNTPTHSMYVASYTTRNGIYQEYSYSEGAYTMASFIEVKNFKNRISIRGKDYRHQYATTRDGFYSCDLNRAASP